MHELGDLVILNPMPPATGKIIKVHENGQVTVMWPSGTTNTLSPERLVTVVTRETLIRLINLNENS